MNESDTGFGGIGPWIAIASEIPCSVIALLLVGQIVGQSISGSSGATWGAILGAIFGFFLGVYGTYRTVNYLERAEVERKNRPTYMPPLDEILEDVVFDLDDETSE
ncbi:MAG: hypothetical protein JW779_00205 [Candidatus Thorarchaeota archaeon]|nr:hypothetical protein [Candidatus Thorarchaeota archaeon]